MPHVTLGELHGYTVTDTGQLSLDLEQFMGGYVCGCGCGWVDGGAAKLDVLVLELNSLKVVDHRL